MTLAQGRPTMTGCAIMASRTRFSGPSPAAKALMPRAIASRGTAKFGALQPSIPSFTLLTPQ